MRDCTFRAVIWGMYGYCYVHMVTGCVHYGYGDGSVSACRSARTLCPLVCDTAYTVTTSVAGGCVKPSVGSSSRAPGNKNVNEQKRTALDVCLCATADRVGGGPAPAPPGALPADCSRWDVRRVAAAVGTACASGHGSCFWPAVGESRPARATASAAGRKRSTKRFYYAYPTTDEPCTIMNVRRRDMRGTGPVGSRPDPSRD